MGVVYILLGILAWIILTVIAVLITAEREDGTTKTEVIILCIFLSPVLAIILEMLKPYKPGEKK